MPGIGRNSSTSIDGSPGAWKCGWSSSSFSTASTDSASRIENPPIGGLLGPERLSPLGPSVATVPRGEPMSAMAPPTRPAQFIHSSIPACPPPGSEAAICSVAGTDDRYNTKYLDIGSPPFCVRLVAVQLQLTLCALT